MNKQIVLLLLVSLMTITQGCSCEGEGKGVGDFLSRFQVKSFWPFGTKEAKKKRPVKKSAVDSQIVKQSKEIKALEQRVQIRKLKQSLLSKPKATPKAAPKKKGKGFFAFWGRWKTTASSAQSSLDDAWSWVKEASFTVAIAFIVLVVLISLGSFVFSILGVAAEFSFSLAGLGASLFGSGIQILITVSVLVGALLLIPFVNGGFNLDMSRGIELGLAITAGALGIIANFYKLKKAKSESDRSGSRW